MTVTVRYNLGTDGHYCKRGRGEKGLEGEVIFMDLTEALTLAVLLLPPYTRLGAYQTLTNSFGRRKL